MSKNEVSAAMQHEVAKRRLLRSLLLNAVTEAIDEADTLSDRFRLALEKDPNADLYAIAHEDHGRNEAARLAEAYAKGLSGEQQPVGGSNVKKKQPNYTLRVRTEDGAVLSGKGDCADEEAFALWMLADWMRGDPQKVEPQAHRQKFREAVTRFMRAAKQYRSDIEDLEKKAG